MGGGIVVALDARESTASLTNRGQESPASLDTIIINKLKAILHRCLDSPNARAPSHGIRLDIFVVNGTSGSFCCM